MTVESERTSQRRENQAHPPAPDRDLPRTGGARDNHRPAGYGGYEDGNDDNSDLLRWRADQLLDEMMLGAVDVSAADLDGRPAPRPVEGAREDRSPEDRSPVEPYAPSHRDSDVWGVERPHPHSGNRNHHDAGPADAWHDHSNNHDYTQSHDSSHEHSNGYGAWNGDGHRHHGNGYEGHGDENHAAPRSSPAPREAAPDIDIYFDAYESASERISPARRPSARPAPADDRPDAQWARPGDAGDRRPDSLRDDYRHAENSRERYRDDSRSSESRVNESRDGESRPTESRYTEPDLRPSSRAASGDGLLSSKINDADYLARRYGYVEDTEPEEARLPDPFDVARGRGAHDEYDEYGARRPDGGERGNAHPTESSRAYYEGQRVDREERMRSAERRPEEPRYGNPAANPRASREDERGEPPAGGLLSSRSSARDDDYPRARRDDLIHRGLHRELSMETPDASLSDNEDTGWIHQAKEKWNWQDISGVAKETAADMGSGAASLYEFELAGYDRDPRVMGDRGAGNGTAGPMMSNGKLRSTLLPRMSSTSVDALHEQMTELHQQIIALLPAGHEYSARARHLLEKAGTILQSDPMRSAEVEYYMQQVRGILQRQHQANRMSNLYRDRLQLYLGAWLAFSFVILLARYLFQFEFDAFLAGTFGLDYSNVFLQNAAALAGSLFAGALGGSIGALLTLMRHTRQPHGYVDRKYGLRGLILPLIGFIMGGIIYVPFGLFFYVIGLDPSLNMIAASLAAICAFAFGFNQESLYGTRE